MNFISSTKLFYSFLFIFIIGSAVNAQIDTLTVDASSLDNKSISMGKSCYLIYTKKGKDLPATDLTFVEMEVFKTNYQNVTGYKIIQKWTDKDTVSHTSETILKDSNLSTIYHKTWLRRSSQTSEIDYLSGKYIINGGDDKSKQRAEEGFKASLSDPLFVNWHCDLHLFSLLPFNDKKVFKVKVYDPGFSAPRYEFYEVFGTEVIENNPCWILNYKLPNNMGYQRFWISKLDRIVIKEEDNFRGNYRFKLKVVNP